MSIKTPDLFSIDDYKSWLKIRLSSGEFGRGGHSRAAAAMGCHSSYLSQVIHGHVHLTADQAASLANHWNLNSDETDYLLNLVMRDRAATNGLKEFHSKKLQALKLKRTSVSGRLKRDQPHSKLSEAELMVYYRSWHMAAIHVLVSIPEFSTIDRIASRLGISKAFVRSCADDLVGMGFIALGTDGLKVLRSDVHLDGSSPLVYQHHVNWRTYAANHLAESYEQNLHYSGLMAISRSALVEIREKLLQVLAETRQIAGDSPEEELVALNIDLFKV